MTVTAMAEEPSGNYFYTAEKSGRVLQWQADNPSKGFNVIWTGEKLIEVMTVSPDAGWLACGTSTSEIIMIPLKDNNLGYQMTGSGGNIGALVFSSGNDRLYSATVKGQVAEWDLITRTGHNVSQIPSGVTAIDISPDNTFLAGLTSDGKVLVWQIDSGNQVVILDLGEKVITSLRFVPWDERLVTGDSDGNIELWNTREKKISSSFEGHVSPVAHIVFNRTEKQMATAGKDGIIKIWDMKDLGEAPPVITDSGNNILNLGFTDNGRAFLAATAGTLTKRPSHVESMTSGLCEKVTRNLTPEEWTAYVGRDIDYEQTCRDDGYRIKVTQIKGGQ
jgi:WD40 repeat protein